MMSVFRILLPEISPFVRVPAAFQAAFKDVIIDFVGLISNYDDGNPAKVTTFVDLREHSWDILEGIGAEQIENQNIGVGIT